jgi:ABC-type transport system substrate-binding protein
MTQAASEPDQAAQQTLYEQVNQTIADDAASLFLRWGVNSQLVRPYVGGLQVTPMDSQVPGEHFYESIQMLVRQ